MADGEEAKRLDELLDTPDLAGALENDRFKQFLDHLPVAIAVSELQGEERIAYANIAFEQLTGSVAAEIQGLAWGALPTSAAVADDGRQLGEAIAEGEDYIGVFRLERDGVAVALDAWSNVIQGDDGTPMFRLVALANITARAQTEQDEVEQRVLEKDLLLRELQHRVKNNLQLITAMIRMEARNLPDGVTGERFDRLAGRVDALALLYRSLSDDDKGESIDLGVYLSEIASAVMRAHAVEGIRLDLRVDTWPVSINVAMPAGLVVNELLTNALKHAFAGREGGTIMLHSLVDDEGCRVVVADDGVGLDEATTWPKPGKLSALIVQSLRLNAKARVIVRSAPGEGVQVTIFFARAEAAPEPH